MSQRLYIEEEDYKHILRVLNTNIEGKRLAPFVIRKTKGIGRRLSSSLKKS